MKPVIPAISAESGSYTSQRVGAQSALFERLNNLNPVLYFSFIFLFQLLTLFQGFDMADGGFLATHYEQVFSHPASVQYNAMFWFTGITGGLFYKLLGFLGIWGIRLTGALFTTATLVLAYRLLIRFMPRIHVFAGLFIVLLAMNNDIKEFNYNIYSAFLNVAIVTLLFTGLTARKYTALFLAGLLVAVNTLVRLPNILSAGFGVMLLLHWFLEKDSLITGIKNILVFIAGIIVGFGLLFGIMYKMGHLQYYQEALNVIFNLASGNKPTDAENVNYGLIDLIKQYFFQALKSLQFLFLILFYLTLIYLLRFFTTTKARNLDLPGKLLILFSVLVLAYVYLSGAVKYDTLLYLLYGTGLVFTLGAFLPQTTTAEKILAAGALFMLLYFPFGSSEGIVTAGRYSLWLAFPLGLHYLLSLRPFRFDLRIGHQQEERQLRFAFDAGRLRAAQLNFVLFCMAAGLIHVYFYPYFDKQSRLQMTASIDSPKLRGIYTTPGRAAAFNELLQASERYITPNTPVLAYDCIPMVYFATSTYPYLHNSWPWLYQNTAFRNDLEQSRREHDSLPVIVRQKIKTIGSGSKWPAELVEMPYENWSLSRERNAALSEFINENHYKEVWSSAYFSILIPDNKTLNPQVTVK